jgi:hypothetical protein
MQHEIALALFAWSRGETIEQAEPKWADVSPDTARHFLAGAQLALEAINKARSPCK